MRPLSLDEALESIGKPVGGGVEVS